MNGKNSMRLILSHPTGNSFVKSLLQGLYKNNLLEEFDTTISIHPNVNWLNILPIKVKNELLRRSFPIPSSYIWTFPWLEIWRIILPKLGFENFTTSENTYASIDKVYQGLDKAVSKRIYHKKTKKNIDAVYAYEDGACETFRAAKNEGIKCIYDLPIAYWETLKKLLTEEAERLPQWKKTLGGGINDSTIKLERKTKELTLADIVVVPSQFVVDSLPDWTKNKKVILAPFGSPPSLIYDKTAPTKNIFKRPLRVLFAGSMGQRKGLSDLFKAIQILNNKNIELIVMGSLMETMDFYKNELPNFTYECNRPHDEVLALMRTCDIFCLPSIVEGRALVMQEAMSQGLPIIITPNTGGSDLIEEGKTGFLVPIRDPEAIAEKLSWFNENRSEIPHMSIYAREHTAKYSWQNYSQQIISSLINVE